MALFCTEVLVFMLSDLVKSTLSTDYHVISFTVFDHLND